MDKPSGAFFETLGQYVYAYKNPKTEEWDYIGKGNGDRCWSHVESKGLDPDNLYIRAKNLEKFYEKGDWQSFLLESFLISTEQPKLNSVSGHYKECFEMASLSSMFSDYVSSQHDNFETFPEWYTENYDTFRGRIREIKINSGNFFLLSNARNAIYMMWYWDPNVEEVKVTFEVNQDGERLDNTKQQIVAWLNENGYDDVFPDGKKQKLAVTAPDIDAVISLFSEFMS
jgi:hypothetical protein